MVEKNPETPEEESAKTSSAAQNSPEDDARQQDLPLTWGAGRAGDREARGRNLPGLTAPAAESVAETEKNARPFEPAQGAPEIVSPSAPKDVAESEADVSGTAEASTTTDVSPARVDVAADEEPDPEPDRDVSMGSDGESTEDSGSQAETIVQLGEVATGFGETLLEARGATNLSIAQVGQRTRIAKDIIAAIEAEDLERMPRPLYTKSYLTKLAEEYGIDPAPLLSDYNQRAGSAEAGNAIGRVAVPTASDGPGSRVCYELRGAPELNKKSGPAGVGRLIVGLALIGVLLLVVTAAVVHLLRRNGANGEEPGTPPPSVSSDVDLEEFIIPQQLPLEELPIPEH